MTDLPSYRKVNPADAPVLFMAMTSPSMNLSELNDYAENLIAPSLSTLPGVAQVTVNGQKRFAVRVRAKRRPDERAQPVDGRTGAGAARGQFQRAAGHPRRPQPDPDHPGQRPADERGRSSPN